MAKETKKLNPYTKRSKIDFRVDFYELQEIVTKAQLYTKGNVGEYVRMAALNYKPLRKGAK